MVSESLGKAAELDAVLAGIGEIAVAVSGGVDSMTLAVAAGRRLGARAEMIHAVSPAVPPEASARVRDYAAREGWRLEVIDAGEFADPDYLANPANRCFFCKTNLYGTIAARTRATIVSGTNLDDLGDWRPGLQAAEAHGVRHPYVEAGIDKNTVRALARALDLHDLAELPAAPCLSSRLATGIRVTAERLRLVHAVERLIAQELAPRTVRCRLFHDGVAIQLDPDALERIQDAPATSLRRTIEDMASGSGDSAVRYEPYRMGSAFLRTAADGA
jgi:pyridinium-3,5-biscarboxylic acid mononucleotide sulfurtransferase